MTKKKVTSVTASGLTKEELDAPPVAPEERGVTQPQGGQSVQTPSTGPALVEPVPPTSLPDEPVTKKELVELLTKWDEQIKAREDEKMHRFVDDIITQLAAQKPETQPGTNLGQDRGQTGKPGMGGGISDILSMLKQFGIMGDESTGPAGAIEQQFAAMLRQGYNNYLNAQMKGFARANGINWHEVEGTAGA